MSALGYRVSRGVVIGVLGTILLGALGLPGAGLALIVCPVAGILKGLHEQAEEERRRRERQQKLARQASRHRKAESVPNGSPTNVNEAYFERHSKRSA